MYTEQDVLDAYYAAQIASEARDNTLSEETACILDVGVVYDENNLRDDAATDAIIEQELARLARGHAILKQATLVVAYQSTKIKSSIAPVVLVEAGYTAMTQKYRKVTLV